VPQYGTHYVYLLKGPGNEMMRYAADANVWEELPGTPVGSGKWDKGSWIAYDGNARIYLHKAKKHELWSRDLVADAWIPGSGYGLPFMNSRDRATKSKEGGSADWRDNGLWALKGGNTDEFWRWEASTGRWTEFEPMPKQGSTGRIRGVGAGGGLVSYPFARVMFGLKGNNTLEFWRYTMKPEEQMAAPQPGPSGVMAQPGIAHDPRIIIEPNPVVGNVVNLQYRLNRSGSGVVTVFDPAGRSVLRQSLAPGLQGAVRLDLSRLSAGVYTVRLEADGANISRKLVKTR
ncbi:MAG: T9SS type A sorting domain-containing protein, partial [candidate division WOR-3 bacterium]